MKKRHAYVTDSLEIADRCVKKARRLGLKDEDISVIARSDIELVAIPDELHDAAPNDTVPAAARGLVGGGATGVLLGLAATVVPAWGVTMAGVGILGVIGAAVGTWSAALMGSAIPNQVRRELEDCIDAGKVLVVLDAKEEQLPQLDAYLTSQGARRADYEALSVLS